MHFKLLADRPSAIPTIARWYFDEWGCHKPGDTFELTCEWLAQQLDRHNLPLAVLAVEADLVLGIAGLKPHEMQSLYPDKHPWLGGVFVRPEARGRGIASQLAAKIVEIAGSRGFQRLFLQTTALDGGLYARLGWQPVEQVHYKGLDVLVMEKQLV
jgi:GNAT superfamily N-acetyltransferase